ncbi:MAG: hypothetical protein ACR2GH_13550 [Pseudonocardia sp.]
MPEHPVSPWRDPLVSSGDRFPLGPPRGILVDCQEGPSGSETRPFSLRHAVAGPRVDTPPSWHYIYCHERQIALVHGGNGEPVPMLRHTKPGPTQGGTSFTTDGDPNNPPPEEMNPPDHQDD